MYRNTDGDAHTRSSTPAHDSAVCPPLPLSVSLLSSLHRAGSATWESRCRSGAGAVAVAVAAFRGDSQWRGVEAAVCGCCVLGHVGVTHLGHVGVMVT